MKVSKDDLGLRLAYSRKGVFFRENCRHIFLDKRIGSYHYEYCVKCNRLKANITE